MTMMMMINVDGVDDDDDAVNDDDDNDHHPDSADDDFDDVKHLIYLLPLLKERFDQTKVSSPGCFAQTPLWTRHLVMIMVIMMMMIMVMIMMMMIIMLIVSPVATAASHSPPCGPAIWW